MLYLLMFFLLLAHSLFSLVTIGKQPLCVVYTPNSILLNKENYPSAIVGSRYRWSTCTGAVWYHDTYLAVLNLRGQNLNIYKFDAEKIVFEHIQEITNRQGADFTKSENVVVSPDGSLLAVCSDNPKAGIKIYSIDPETHLINPQPIFRKKSNHLVHSIRFTPDGSYLAITQWDNQHAVVIYKFSRDHNEISLTEVYSHVNPDHETRAKVINFTRDGKFAVIGYAMRLQQLPQGQFREQLVKGVVAIHKFDTIHGKLGEQTFLHQGTFCYEDFAFIDAENVLIGSEQNSDSLVIYSFNPLLGTLDDESYRVSGPQAQLSFPHGIGLNADNKYLVVTNGGDDKFNLYQIV